MAGEWHRVELGDVADLIRGVSYHPSDLLADGAKGIPLLRATNIRDRALDLTDVLFVPRKLVRDYQLLRRFDVIIAMSSGGRDAVGRLAQLRQEWTGCVGAFCGVIRADPKRIHSEYLGYVLQSRKFREHIETHAVGTAIMNLSRERILGFLLPLPPLPEQRAIAHILGTLDDKIELNRRMSETLEAMARALFKSWFIDFDPVRAKMEGCWQRGQSLPGLPAHLYDLFPARLVDSELGEIPEGWEVKKLSDLCSTQYGYTASAVDMPVGPKLLRVTDINKRNWIEWANVPYCTIDADTQEHYALQVGDLVVARMADPGKSAINEEDVDAVFASYLVRLKTASLAHSYYIFGFLKSDLYSEYVERAKSGSVQSNMNAKIIVGTSLVVPPIQLMDRFLGVILPLRRRLVACVQESRTLSALRDTLLPKLISGELRVKDAEQFLKKRGL